MKRELWQWRCPSPSIALPVPVVAWPLNIRCSMQGFLHTQRGNRLENLITLMHGFGDDPQPLVRGAG